MAKANSPVEPQAIDGGVPVAILQSLTTGTAHSIG